jgi:hypothetical protein
MAVSAAMGNRYLRSPTADLAVLQELGLMGAGQVLERQQRSHRSTPARRRIPAHDHARPTEGQGRQSPT